MTHTVAKPFPRGVASLCSNAPSSLVVTYEGDTTSQTPVVDKILEDVTKQLNVDILIEFEMLCRQHDWTYAYSDDHRYWVAGEMSIDKLRVVQNRLEKDDHLRNFGREIYTHYYKRAWGEEPVYVQ